MTARLPATLLLLALAIPVATASTATLAFGDGFRTAALHAEAQVDGPESEILRRQMDLAGDRNGNVSADEARNFLSDAQGFLGGLVARSITGGNLTLDGAPPTTTTVQALVATGAEGSVDSQAPIAVELNLTMLFPAQDAPTHTLAAVGHPTPGGDLTLTLAAPAGWRVQAGAGMPNVTVTPSADGTSLAFVMPTEGQPLVFTFTPTTTKGGPGLGVPVVLAMVLAAAGLVATRRRRVGP